MFVLRRNWAGIQIAPSGVGVKPLLPERPLDAMEWWEPWHFGSIVRMRVSEAKGVNSAIWKSPLRMGDSRCIHQIALLPCSAALSQRAR